MQRIYLDQIRPVLRESCGDCHWGDNDDAGLSLEPFETIEQLLNARSVWKKIRLRVAAREMPPEDAASLTDQQHQDVITWIDQLLESVDCTDINPGRVTIRRLNRTEYQNTVRDLVGVDYEPADSFPGDDVGYGFDNIADVLSLPPLLFEKYLTAAETISRRAIIEPGSSRYLKVIAATDFPETRGTQHIDGIHAMFSSAIIWHPINVPRAGTYSFEVRASAEQAGDERAMMLVSSDHNVLAELEVADAARAQAKSHDWIPAPVTLRFEAELDKGQQRLKLTYPNDHFVEAAEGRPKQDRNLYIMDVKMSGPLRQATAFQQQYFPYELLQQPEKTGVAVRQGFEKLLARVWRRPLAEGELDRMISLYDQAVDQGDSPYAAIRRCLQATLISPSFLFRIEPTSFEATGSAKRLNDFELATRLSYFLWSTMPDDELFRLADSNTLHQPDVLRQQVLRMLRDDRSQALVDNFGGQWLQLTGIDVIQPDPDEFPGITDQLKQDMRKETLLLVQDVIRNDLSIMRFLDADYSYINNRLARHYGMDDFESDDQPSPFRRVAMSDVGRFGLLNHASILSITSNPTRTSPVKRGKWIMENLLGEEPPPPDPAAVPLEDQKQLTGTMRERMIQHREDPNCAVCHKVMDELGFALENFDGVGRWRDEDDGSPVDASGELPDGTSFEGAKGLQKLLVTKMKDQFVRCFAEKLLIYALGRGLEYFDECAIDDILEQAGENEQKFSEFVLAVVNSDPFCKVRDAK